MQYRYNYSYLAEWMEANSQIPINTILQAIGSKSNNSLRSWEQRLCAMPVITLLRFCNSFQIPIEAFVCNTGEPFTNKMVIPATAQFEPEGGYTNDPTLRQPGERKPLDPTNVNIVPSVLPNVSIQTACKKEVQTETEDLSRIEMETVAKNERCDGYEPPHPEVGASLLSLIALQQSHAENEAEHLKQQQTMLGIIQKQQAQIAALTKQLQEERKHNRGYGPMVAEP